jgi:hypothetical protein
MEKNMFKILAKNINSVITPHIPKSMLHALITNTYQEWEIQHAVDVYFQIKYPEQHSTVVKGVTLERYKKGLKTS